MVVNYLLYVSLLNRRQFIHKFMLILQRNLYFGNLSLNYYHFFSSSVNSAYPLSHVFLLWKYFNPTFVQYHEFNSWVKQPYRWSIKIRNSNQNIALVNYLFSVKVEMTKYQWDWNQKCWIESPFSDDGGTYDFVFLWPRVFMGNVFAFKAVAALIYIYIYTISISTRHLTND